MCYLREQTIEKYVELIVVWCICIIYASIIIYLVLLGLWLYTSLKGASIKVWNAKHRLSYYNYKKVIISIIFHRSWSFSWKKYITEYSLINSNFSDPPCSSRTLVISYYETMHAIFQLIDKSAQWWKMPYFQRH